MNFASTEQSEEHDQNPKTHARKKRAEEKRLHRRRALRLPLSVPSHLPVLFASPQRGPLAYFARSLSAGARTHAHKHGPRDCRRPAGLEHPAAPRVACCCWHRTQHARQTTRRRERSAECAASPRDKERRLKRKKSGRMKRNGKRWRRMEKGSASGNIFQDGGSFNIVTPPRLPTRQLTGNNKLGVVSHISSCEKSKSTRHVILT